MTAMAVVLMNLQRVVQFVLIGKNKIIMKQKLKMIWRILRDRQVVVITEDHGRMYYNWDTRSLKDVCQMCRKIHDMAFIMDNKK